MMRAQSSYYTLHNQATHSTQDNYARNLMDKLWTLGVDLILHDNAYRKSTCLQFFSKSAASIHQDALLARFQQLPEFHLQHGKFSIPNPLHFVFLSKVALDHLSMETIINLFKALHSFEPIPDSTEPSHDLIIAHFFPDGSGVLSVAAAKEIIATYINRYNPKIIDSLINWQLQKALNASDYGVDNQEIFYERIKQQWRSELRCEALIGDGTTRQELIHAIKQIYKNPGQGRNNKYINFDTVEHDIHARLPLAQSYRHQQ